MIAYHINCNPGYNFSFSNCLYAWISETCLEVSERSASKFLVRR